jgi:RND superfamily putative drug exporter
LGVWVGVVLILGAGAGLFGSRFTNSSRPAASDSTSAYNLLASVEGGSAASAKSGNIVWRTSSGSAVSPRVVAAAQPVLEQVERVPGVTSVSSPFGGGHMSQVSADGRTAYATVTFASTAHADQAESLARSLDRDGLTVWLGGSAFASHVGVSEGVELLGVIAAFLILLLVFRSFWAAVLPIVTGVVGVAAATLLIVLASHAVSLPDTTPTMGALVGLAVGIDYALFIVHRHRQNLAAGADLAGSVGQALDTSGRAVLFAGATVVVALLGMLVLGVTTLSGMAVGAAVTVAVTAAAATTLLPGLVGMLDRRVLPRGQRWGGQAGTVAPRARLRLWAAWAARGEARPRRYAVAGAAVLVALAAPLLSMRLGAADASSDPTGSASHAYYDVMARGFGPGFDAPLLVVAKTPTPQAEAAFERLAHTLARTEGVASVSQPAALGRSGVSTLTVIPTTNAQAAATADLVRTVRADAMAAALRDSGLQPHVGGPTASGIDFASILSSKLPLFLAVIALLGFGLLVVAFRSVVAPLIGSLSNLATILVALGISTTVFQLGWGSSMFGIGSTAPIEYIVPVMVVGIMFGLSMDYQVFLVSRIREEWARGDDHRRAVSVGVGDTGRVIATAAMIMVCVFGSFAFGGQRVVTELGVALAVAVAFDAFVVRMTVVPALLRLAGPRTWALPAWLDCLLPHISVEGSRSPGVPRQPALFPVGASDEPAAQVA